MHSCSDRDLNRNICRLAACEGQRAVCCSSAASSRWSCCLLKFNLDVFDFQYLCGQAHGMACAWPPCDAVRDDRCVTLQCTIKCTARHASCAYITAHVHVLCPQLVAFAVLVTTVAA